MTEEALLWRVIPAIALPGHGLDKGSILELVDKGVAGIMAALIAVDNSCVIQLGSIFAAHGVNHVENKIDSKIVTEPVGQYFMCTDIQNRGQITDPASVKEVGNICQQGLTRRIASELSVNLVLCHMARFHRLGHLTVRICLTNGATESVFLHQTADLLDVHDNRRIKMQQAHVDTACALLVSTKLIGLLHQGIIRTVGFFSALP